MKVALVSYILDPNVGGGAVRSAQILAEGLAERGDEVLVITTHPRRGEAMRADLYAVRAFYPSNLYWVGHKDRQPTWKKIPWQVIDIWNPQVFGVVRGILRREQPDVVHVNKLRGLSPSVWAAARSEEIPVVHTCRDYELFSPEGTLGSRVGAMAERGDLALRPYQWLRRRFSRGVAAAIAPSRHVLDAHVQRGFFRSAIQQVIPNSHGLSQQELNLLRGAARPRTAGGVRLLYLGRLELVKGVDVLCAAFVKSAARFPDLRLDVAGWGTLGAVLREQYGGHPQIAFHGAVFGQEKASLLAGCDAVVVPSVWPESFGNVVLEAYAYGKPVIAARSGGIPEVVAEGETGWLVPFGDLERLAHAISNLAEAPASAGRMSESCFAAARRYDRQSVAEEYASLYHRIVANR